MKKIFFLIVVIVGLIDNAYSQDDLSIEYPIYPNAKEPIIIQGTQCEIYYKDTLKNGDIINYVCLNNLFNNLDLKGILFIKGTNIELNKLKESLFPYTIDSVTHEIVTRKTDFAIYSTSKSFFDRFYHIKLIQTSYEDYISLETSYNEDKFESKTEELNIREAHLGYTLHNLLYNN
jgi:hypothetical protein